MATRANTPIKIDNGPVLPSKRPALGLALEKLAVGQAYISTPDFPGGKKVFMEP